MVILNEISIKLDATCFNLGNWYSWSDTHQWLWSLGVLFFMLRILPGFSSMLDKYISPVYK